ncbi:MAG: c-type cytochrome [Flavobacteriales bacterium]|jgi:cytochrome c peroxidase|nr:c-type cytochrome [Flavobacteriales bacterium]
MKFYLFLGIPLVLFSCIEQPQNSSSFEENVTQYDQTIDSEITLGAKLFFDPILSKDQSISCASCHNPEFAFADSSALSKGVSGALGTRNTPTVMNTLSRPFLFHDGRANSLEEQAVGPIENPVEMNLSYTEAVERVQNSEHYQYYFKKVFNHSPDSSSILTALAEFQRSLESDGSAPHDLWMNEEDTTAMSPAQIRGRTLFLTKAKCFDCHFGPDFTGDEFRNIGLYDAQTLTDKGRYDVTNDSSDLGKFKVPGLRNITLTAPYMHNGMFKTLEEVVAYYNNPYLIVKHPINMDTLMLEPLNLTEEEQSDIVAFMESLTDQNIPYRTTKE